MQLVVLKQVDGRNITLSQAKVNLYLKFNEK